MQDQPSSMPKHSLRLTAFDGGWNLPIWAAEACGYFEAEGLHVDVTYTPSSAALVSGLVDGSFDVAFAGADNFIAYQHAKESERAASEVERASELLMVIGGDQGFLSLVGAPEVADIAALRGKVVALDSLTTGFAFVARELLERAGLPASAVEFKAFGGTNLRYSGLLQRSFDATLLRTPFDQLAVDKGFRLLSSASGLGAYQGTVGTVRRQWADDNRSHLVRFVRAYARGLQWSLQMGNRAQAQALLCSRVPDLDADGASAALEVLLAPDDGFSRDLRVSTAGLDIVLALRAKYGPQGRRSGSAQDYFDHSILDEALAT